MLKTYRFRTYPNEGHIHILDSTLNECRELYNAMLEQRIYAYEHGKRVNYYSQQNEIPGIKKMFPEFSDVHSQVLQDVASRLDKAYDNFFRRVEEIKQGKKIKAGFPRFKSKYGYNSITYTQSGFKVMDNGHVLLSKIGEIRTFMHRSIMGEIKTITIKRDRVGDWFVTITAETVLEKRREMDIAVEEKEAIPVNPIGVDLGLKALITTSEGEQIEPPQFLRKSEKKLKRAKRQFSKKKKGSGKRKKARIKVARVERVIARQRDDSAHKISTNLVASHDLIVYEDLNIEGMVQNHHLAKSISDASWGKIIQYTTYKAESAGSIVMLVNPAYTSQECSQCGNVKHDLELSDRIYHCDICGLVIDRDLNAALNIKRKGLREVGRGTPEFTPVEIEPILERASSIGETGSPR